MPLGNRRIDAHVGLRLRQRRMAMGMKQADLANAVGLTFQQIQKYESGSNQIVSSRLYELGVALDVPVAFFFEGLTASAKTDVNPETRSLMGSTEMQRLILAYWQIDKAPIRKHVRDLIHSLVGRG